MLFIEADEKQGKERVTLEYSNFMGYKMELRKGAGRFTRSFVDSIFF